VQPPGGLHLRFLLVPVPNHGWRADQLPAWSHVIHVGGYPPRSSVAVQCFACAEFCIALMAWVDGLLLRLYLWQQRGLTPYCVQHATQPQSSHMFLCWRFVARPCQMPLYYLAGGMEYKCRSLCQCDVQGTCPYWVQPSPVVGTLAGLTCAGCSSLVHTSLVHQPVTMRHTRIPFCITLVHGGPHFQTVGGQHAHLAHMHASQPSWVKCLRLGPSGYGCACLSTCMRLFLALSAPPVIQWPALTVLTGQMIRSVACSTAVPNTALRGEAP
jgi:hypothetical protein